MSGNDRKQAITCEAELYLHFSNKTRERSKYISENYEARCPLYEILSHQQGDFSLCFSFGTNGSYLAHEVPVSDVRLFLRELKESLELDENGERFVKTAVDNLTIAIRRQAQSAIVYNLHRDKEKNSTDDSVYEVPWSEYGKMVKATRKEYALLIQRIRNHTINYLSENSTSNPVNGISLTVQIENKAPLLGDQLALLFKIMNVSKDIKYLVGDFDINISNEGSNAKIRISGRPIEGLKRKPKELKPGEFLSLSKNISIKDFLATVEVEYSASNDFSMHTSMMPELFLKGIGDHYDLSRCWQGTINANASLFVRAQNWEEVVKPVKIFDEWLKQIAAAFNGKTLSAPG